MSDSAIAAPAAPEAEAAPKYPAQPVKKRVAALDQFRGYTMAGMFFVNFCGGYNAIHPVFGHHHTYCSYADTIMPGFFFAAGFAFRLTFTQRLRECGMAQAAGHALWRNIKLILIGMLFYNILDIPGIPQAFAEGHGWERVWHLLTIDSFQALVSIGVACIWILPVIGLSSRVRWGYALFSCVLYIVMLKTFYYDYAHNHVIDGGPLGFVGWSIPTLLGTLVCDAVRENRDPAAQWKRMWWWAAGLMLLGYGMSCLTLWSHPAEDHPTWARYLAEPPFIAPPDVRPQSMWTMDQQISGPSYMVFSAGFSVGVYLLFVLIADAWNIQFGVFRTLGKNPLFGYMYEDVVGFAVGPALTMDSSLAAVLFIFGVFFAIIWATLRFMEYKNWYWRL